MHSTQWEEEKQNDEIYVLRSVLWIFLRGNSILSQRQIDGTTP